MCNTCLCNTACATLLVDAVQHRLCATPPCLCLWTLCSNTTVLGAAAQKPAHTVLSSPSLPLRSPPFSRPEQQSCQRYLLGGGAGKETLVDMRVKVDQNTFKIPSTFKSPPTTSVRNKRRENWFALREQPVQGFIGLSNQCKVESAPLLAFFFSSPFTQRVSHSVLAFSDHFFISTH